MRLHVLAASLIAAAAFTVSGAASAEPRTVLIRDFVVPTSIVATPDGRAMARAEAEGSNDRAYLLGPGDRVERIPSSPSSPSSPEGPPATGVPAAPPPPPPPRGRLTLSSDGVLLRDGARAPLELSLLHALGPTRDRHALAYDETRGRYVLVRSRQPIPGSTDTRLWLVWFSPERVLDEAILPEVDLPAKPPLAVANNIVWLGTTAGVLRFQNGDFVAFGDEAGVLARRDDERRDRNDTISKVSAFTLGTAASSAFFSLPVSAIGKQRYLPTATTTLVGAVPGMLTAGLLGESMHVTGEGSNNSLIAAAILSLGTLSVPVVALGTWATGGAAWHGTNGGPSYAGALAGAASGALVWTVAMSFLSKETFNDYFRALIPLGGGFISAASTTGYLWAGGGFVHR